MVEILRVNQNMNFLSRLNPMSFFFFSLAIMMVE